MNTEDDTTNGERAIRFFHSPDEDQPDAAGPCIWVIDCARYPSAKPLELAAAKLNNRLGGKPVRMAHDSAGRPIVATEQDGPTVSLSRCPGAFAAVIALTGRVGVDIQSPADVKDLDSLAREMLGDGERCLLADVPSSQRAMMFCRMWTLKEAWMKAVGHGLGIGPASIETLPDPANPRQARILAVHGIAALARGWNISQQLVDTTSHETVVSVVWG